MVLRDMLDDAQAEAGASAVPRARGVDSIEALEDPLRLVFGDARALVGDGDLDDPVDAAHPYADAGMFR
jgi:hypothetical protein